MIFFDFIIIVLMIQSIFFGLSCLEKKFLKNQNTSPYEVVDNLSLLWFKRIRIFNNILVAIEIVTIGSPDIQYITMGTILIFIGTSFRIGAIRSLAQFWNFNVVRYTNQPIVTTGIYKYFSHPSYIGNIANVGVYMLFGAILSASFATVWLCLFASYRISLERKHALCR